MSFSNCGDQDWTVYSRCGICLPWTTVNFSQLGKYDILNFFHHSFWNKINQGTHFLTRASFSLKQGLWLHSLLHGSISGLSCLICSSLICCFSFLNCLSWASFTEAVIAPFSVAAWASSSCLEDVERQNKVRFQATQAHYFLVLLTYFLISLVRANQRIIVGSSRNRNQYLLVTGTGCREVFRVCFFKLIMLLFSWT